MAWRHRFRHYVGVEKEETKLSALFARFPFAPASEVLLSSQGEPVHRPAAAGLVAAGSRAL